MKLRKIIYKAYKKCIYCGLELSHSNKKLFSLDHLTPKSRGGNYDYANLVLSCKPCNEKKDSKTLEEFLIDYDEELRQVIKDDIIKCRKIVRTLISEVNNE